MGLIHEPFEDGAEILWNLEQLTQKEARALVASNSELVENLKRELRQ